MTIVPNIRSQRHKVVETDFFAKKEPDREQEARPAI
jgi:hypothetical protein